MARRIYLALAALCGLMSNANYREQKLKQQYSPMCDLGWVKDSPTLSDYFNCGSEAGGGGSGAGLDDDVTPSERAIDLSTHQ